jgi:hypothetical protein
MTPEFTTELPEKIELREGESLFLACCIWGDPRPVGE